MPQPDKRLVDALDLVDQARDADGRPLVSERALQALVPTSDLSEALAAILSNDAQPMHRRYLALQALAQIGGDAWRASRIAPTSAHILAHAMADDRSHNHWGLPGAFVGPSGQLFLELPAGVPQALLALLQDSRLLNIYGSEAATVQALANYRVRDLASYLLARYAGLPWVDSTETMVRDRAIDDLVREFGRP